MELEPTTRSSAPEGQGGGEAPLPREDPTRPEEGEASALSCGFHIRAQEAISRAISLHEAAQAKARPSDEELSSSDSSSDSAGRVSRLGSGGGGAGGGQGLRRDSKEATVAGVAAFDDPEQAKLAVQQALERLPIFSKCSENFLQAVTDVATVGVYAPGVPVLSGFETSQSLLVVHHGRVQMLVEGVVVGLLPPGRYIGELVLIGVEPSQRVELRSDPDVDDEAVLIELGAGAFWATAEGFPTDYRSFAAIRRSHRDPKPIGTLVNTWELFRDLEGVALARVDEHMRSAMYFPGEHIVREGSLSEDLFILARGWVGIELGGRTIREESMDHVNTSTLKDVVVFGEAGLIGAQPIQSASVVARSICVMRVLHRASFHHLLKVGGEALAHCRLATAMKSTSMQQRMDSGGASRFLGTLPLFLQMGCSEKFLDHLGASLESRVFLAGQKIRCEHQPSDRCMYILRSGTARVEQEGQLVDMISENSVIGDMSILGFGEKLVKEQPTSVIATSMCFVQVLGQGIFLKGLEQFPEELETVLNMANTSSFDPNLPTSSGAAGPGAGGAGAFSARGGGGYGVGPQPSFREAAAERVIQESPFFTENSPAFAQEVKLRAVDRIYLPGDYIMEEGLRGDSMFLVISGEASVLISSSSFTLGTKRSISKASDSSGGRGDRAMGPTLSAPEEEDELPMFRRPSEGAPIKVATLKRGNITGELAMLGVSHFRTATVQASTVCCCWELMHKDALAIFERHPDVCKHFEQMLCKNLEQTVSQRILTLPTFQEFDRQFLTILVLKSRSNAFFAKQKIVCEGKTSRSLYIINRGSASLERRKIEVRTFSAGSHFNATAMLGSKRPLHFTLTAQQTCHIIRISHGAFQTATQIHPVADLAAGLAQKAEIEEQQLKELVRRAVARLRMQRTGVVSDKMHQTTDALRMWHNAQGHILWKNSFLAWAGLTRSTRRQLQAKAALRIDVSRFAMRSARARQHRDATTPRFDPDERFPVVPTKDAPLRKSGSVMATRACRSARAWALATAPPHVVADDNPYWADLEPLRCSSSRASSVGWPPAAPLAARVPTAASSGGPLAAPARRPKVSQGSLPGVFPLPKGGRFAPDLAALLVATQSPPAELGGAAGGGGAISRRK